MLMCPGRQCWCECAISTQIHDQVRGKVVPSKQVDIVFRGYDSQGAQPETLGT